MTKEHRNKMSIFQKSRPHYNGWKLSEITRKKMSESKKGNKTNLWKGGITLINQQIRSSLEYKLWRESVFKRDKYICQWCNSIKSLEVDHITPLCIFVRKFKIKSFKDAISYKEIWDINNGRTLCRECHKKTSTYGFYRLYKILKEYD
mgnify:FL=1